MPYKIYETREALDDLSHMAEYISTQLQNPKAAKDFIMQYDMEIKKLTHYPRAYKSVGLWYRTYEIRMRSFKTYHVFYIVNPEEQNMIILRILKNRQDWQHILKCQREYHW